jgi:hypothetical protein
MEAMFQGTQFLTYDLTRRGDSFFSSNDELSMHFKTTEMNGLLFYTGNIQVGLHFCHTNTIQLY